jgi:LPXTG-site transpeptidase (sortase) family protein
VRTLAQLAVKTLIASCVAALALVSGTRGWDVPLSLPYVHIASWLPAVPGPVGESQPPERGAETVGWQAPAGGATVGIMPAVDELKIPGVVPSEARSSQAPISGIEVPRLALISDVVPAPIVGVSGGTTWDVPAFVVGHGENTAGAGQDGNAVLIGHVSTPNAGSIFRDVNLLRTGDVVRVFSGAAAFDYVVTQVRTVPRTDLSVLVPTDTPVVTLLTCTGAWLPALQDYSHRLAVRAELSPGG